MARGRRKPKTDEADASVATQPLVERHVLYDSDEVLAGGQWHQLAGVPDPNERRGPGRRGFTMTVETDNGDAFWLRTGASLVKGIKVLVRGPVHRVVAVVTHDA